MPAVAAKNADVAAGAPPSVPPAIGRKKKLLLAAAVAGVLLLVAAAGAATLLLGGKRAAADNAELDAEQGAGPEQHDAKNAHRSGPPTFEPLDPFTVNLADREAERYAQVGITLELEEPKDVETVKQYMPAIRNNILMVLAHKTSAELLQREGKAKLADEVRREALRALGVEPADPEAPVRAVQFSNFIIQ